AGRLPLRGYLGQARRRRSGRRHACDVPQPGAEIGRVLGHGGQFRILLARNRCKPPVTRPQFRAWASTLGVPIGAYANGAWLSRIPDVATQMIFGGAPGLNVSASG